MTTDPAPSPSLTDDLTLALRLADAADVISRDRFRAVDLHVTTKPDRTPVTDADRAVERAIRALLETERPGDAVLGEEYGGASGAHPARQWIIDPIDGTANFLRGIPVWASLIALALDGVPVVGVVSAPALGRRWWAARGAGAFTTDLLDGGADSPERLRASGVTRLDDASLSYNSFKGWDDEGRLPQLTALARAVERTRAYGEMWSYMMVAEGRLEIAAEFDLQPYDMAALVPIVEEAGGRFTSADGAPGPWGGSALATNGPLHDEVLRMIAAG
ncbi:histidinol phosphatase [Herbiconiux moechotypicola]|uniref:Histidinol-phosphatase n=1 Tax=Herbiconiux moechotypicola TaxID=637393 RepID=A0ABP5Q1U6_9MICO|nr:inositol monophosphatase family protein [Herbiconiux moechotypicola]MCS5728381.1 histidinol phosphatase [Herbiconiux moechotypicola]